MSRQFNFADQCMSGTGFPLLKAEHYAGERGHSKGHKSSLKEAFFELSPDQRQTSHFHADVLSQQPDSHLNNYCDDVYRWLDENCRGNFLWNERQTFSDRGREYQDTRISIFFHRRDDALLFKKRFVDTNHKGEKVSPFRQSHDTLEFSDNNRLGRALVFFGVADSERDHVTKVPEYGALQNKGFEFKTVKDYYTKYKQIEHVDSYEFDWPCDNYIVELPFK